jgi:chromosome partitioning protein
VRTITVTNQKGGIGKTTTAHNLAVALSRTGMRVLALDADPQANFTRRAGVTVNRGEPSMLEVFTDKLPIADIIRTTEQGFDIAPCTARLLTVDTNAPDSHNSVRHLRRALQAVAPRYDYCLIDTAPCMSLRFLIVSALLAADSGVIIPFTPNTDAIIGVRTLLGEIEQFRAENATLEAVAVVPVRVRDMKIQENMLEALTAALPGYRVADPVVQHGDFDKAEAYATSVFHIAPRGPGAQSYAALAELVKQVRPAQEAYAGAAHD